MTASNPSSDFDKWRLSWHERLESFRNDCKQGNVPDIVMTLSVATPEELEAVFKDYLDAELDAVLGKKQLPSLDSYIGRLVPTFEQKLSQCREIVTTIVRAKLPQLPGHYRIDAVLGHGGMGRVFQVRHLTLDRDDAIKVILPTFAADPDLRRRFLREAKAAAKLKHTNIVTVYHAEEFNGTLYLAMELLQGEGLQERLNRTGALPLDQIVSISNGIAAGLAAAHNAGYVHRDIKPSNIWLETGTPEQTKLLDFGLARKEEGDSHLTQAGNECGTRTYMAPERLSGVPADAKSDLFSLGCVMYYMASGRPPYHDRPPNPAPPSLMSFNNRLPNALVELIERLMDNEPDRRPDSARQVLSSLGSIAADINGNGAAVADFTGLRQATQEKTTTAAFALPSADGGTLLAHLWEKALCAGEGALVANQRRLFNTVLRNDDRINRGLTLLQAAVWKMCEDDSANPFIGSQHVLLSGATGSGKSTVAEMFLLGTPVHNYKRYKSIYVAPTRALAQAKYRDLRDLLEGDELFDEAVLSTGEDTLDDSRIAQGNFTIACLVYEKANVLFSRNQEILAEIGLCVVDEMHMLADPHRGPLLELLLAKLLEQRQKSEGLTDDTDDRFRLRVIGITTEGGAEPSVISFFSYENRQTNLEEAPRHIDSPERPVAIDYHFVLPPPKPPPDDWILGRGDYIPWDLFHLMKVEGDRPRVLSAHERQDLSQQLAQKWAALLLNRKDYHEKARNELNRRLVAFLLSQLRSHPDGRRWLVFIPSKGLMDNIAWELRGKLEGRSAFRAGLPAELIEALEDAEDKEEAAAIEKLAIAGFFLHHSDIPTLVRRAVEQICDKPLQEQPSQVLFCTETLSFGVNLAVNDVLMLGTEFFSSDRSKSDVEPRNLSACYLHNMAGRAGRLGRSDQGPANYYLFVPLERKSPIPLILDRYFKDIKPLWSQLFVAEDKDAFDRVRTSLVRESKFDQYVALGRLRATDFSYPFVRSILNALGHCGTAENASVKRLMEFFSNYTLFARQKLEVPGEGATGSNPALERRLFQQALDITLIAGLQTVNL